MTFVPAEVQCHSGYKADEFPKSFILNNKQFIINGIIDRWYKARSDPGHPVSDYFKVVTTCGLQYILKHDMENDHWYCCRQRNASDSGFSTN